MIPLKDNESPNNLHQQYYKFLESKSISKTPWQSLRLKAKRLVDKSKIDKTKHVYNHTAKLNETSFDLDNNVNAYSENLHKIKKFHSKRHRNFKPYHHAPANNIYLRQLTNLNHEVEKSNPTDSFNKSMTNNIIEGKKQNITTSIANRKFKTKIANNKSTLKSAIPVLNESDKLPENSKIIKHVIAKSNDNISTDFSYCDSINQIFTKTTEPKFRTHKSKTLSKIKGSQILENINKPENKNSSNDFRPKANSTVTMANINNNSTFNMPEIDIDAIKKTSRFGWGKVRNRDKLKLDERSNQIQIPKIIDGNDNLNAIEYLESDQKSIDSINNDTQTLKSTIKNRKPYSKIPKIRHLNKNAQQQSISTRALSKENGSVEQNDSLNDELNVTKFEPNTITHHKTTARFGKMHKKVTKENAFSQRIPKNNVVLGTPFITENSVESDNLNFDQNLVTVKSRPFGKMHKTNDINQTYNMEQSKNAVISVSKKINNENHQPDNSSISVLHDKTNLDNPIDIKKTQFGKVHKSKNTKQNNTNNIELTASKNINHHQVNTTHNDEINISNMDSNPIITLRPFGEKRKTKNIIINDKRTKLNAIDAVIKLEQIPTQFKLSDQNSSYVITNDEIADNQNFDENQIGKERQFSKMDKSNNALHLKNIVENVPILSEKNGIQGDSLIDEINTDNYQNVLLKPSRFSKMHKVNNTTYRSNHLAINIDQNPNFDNQTRENYKLNDSINGVNTTKNPSKPQAFGKRHKTKSQIQVKNIQQNANEQHIKETIEKTHTNYDDTDKDVILNEQTFVKSMATHVFASKVKRRQSCNPHLINKGNNANSKIDMSKHAIDRNEYTDSINGELNTTNANQNPTLKPRGFGRKHRAKSSIQVNNIRQNAIKHLNNDDIDNSQSKDDTSRDAILNEQTFVKDMAANAINARVKRSRSFNPGTMNTNINANSKIQMDSPHKMDNDSNMDLTTLENMKDVKSSQPYQTLRNKPNKLLPCRTNLYTNLQNPENHKNLAENKNDSDMTLICDMDGPIDDVGKNKFNVLRNKTFKPQLLNLEAQNFSPFSNNTKRNNIVETEQTINTAAKSIISQNDNIVNYNETYVVDTENYGKKKIGLETRQDLPLPPVVNNSIVPNVPGVVNLPLFNSGDQHNENDAQGGGTYILTTNTLSDFYSTTNKSSKNTVRIHKNTHNLSFGSLDKMSQMYRNRPSTNQETNTISKNTANCSKLRSRKSVRISTIEHHIMPVETADDDDNNDHYYSKMLPRQIKDRKSVFTSTKIGGLINTPHSPMSVKTTLKGLSTYLNDDMTKTFNENSLDIDNEQRSLESHNVPDEIMVNKTTQHTGKISTPRPLTHTKSLLLSLETNVPLSIITRKKGNNIEKKTANPYKSNDRPTTSSQTFDNFVTINSPNNEETLAKEHRIPKRRRKPLTQVCRDIRELITTDYLRREKLIDIADKVFPAFRNLENYDELMPLVLSKCEEIIDLNINSYKKVVRLFPFTEPYNLNILEFYLKDICNFSLKDPIFTKMTKFLDPKIRKQLYKTMREDKDTTL